MFLGLLGHVGVLGFAVKPGILKMTGDEGLNVLGHVTLKAQRGLLHLIAATCARAHDADLNGDGARFGVKLLGFGLINLL